MLRLLSLAFVLALGLGLLGCSGKAKETPPPTAADVTIKAGELLKEYGANAVAADAKYKGKILRVTGKFNTAQKVPLMGYTVQLQGEDAGDGNMSGVQCLILESAQEDVAKFQPGQVVTIQGTCDGTPVPGQVKLSKCHVVK